MPQSSRVLMWVLLALTLVGLLGMLTYGPRTVEQLEEGDYSEEYPEDYDDAGVVTH